MSKKPKKPIKPRKPEKKIIEKTEPKKKPIKILKKLAGSVRFRFYKQKTKPNRTKTEKTGKNRARPEKTEPKPRNRAKPEKPSQTGFCLKKTN